MDDGQYNIKMTRLLFLPPYLAILTLNCKIPNFRDKIQERFVELIAQAAARATAPVRPDLVDESRQCGSPGKIVDVGILEQLLRLSPENQVFYGSGTSSRAVTFSPR